MREVYDKVSIRDNEILWDFSKSQPDKGVYALGRMMAYRVQPSFAMLMSG